MRVLVTGAGGFIGSHLTERLIRDGHDVRAMAHYCGRDTYGWLDDIDGCERVRGDVRDYYAVRKFVHDRERVYHLAALGSVPYSFDAPHSFVETNTLGTLNVALACVRYEAELVHTSTSEVYGTAVEQFQSESHPLHPQSPYAASKVGADAMVAALSCSHELRSVILRPFNTYGPRQSARAVIPRIILGGDIGDLRPYRDFMYVSDTVEAFITVNPSMECRVFNAGTSLKWSIDQIYEYITKEIALCGYHGQTRPEKAQVMSLCADARELRELGWEPKVSLKDGLKLTAEWYRGRKLVEGFV